jgi:hypothetical protein
MHVLTSDLQPQPAWVRHVSPARGARQKSGVQQLPAPARAESDARQILGLQQLADFSRLEAFEHHLAAALSSGIRVFFDGGEPLLLSGEAPAVPEGNLRIVIGLDEGGASRFHVLGPGLDASFAMADGSFLAGDADRRRIDLIRYWYRHAKPHLIRTWNDTRSFHGSAGSTDLPARSEANGAWSA